MQTIMNTKIDSIIDEVIASPKWTQDNYYINASRERWQDDLDELAFLARDYHFVPTLLELGGYLGITAVGFASAGFTVTSLESPLYSINPAVALLFRKHRVTPVAHELSKLPLPFESESFDFVVFCETIEHFNFHPNPVLSEILRVLKSSGVLYLTVPNETSLRNRLKLIFGKSINDPIDYFFWELDPSRGFKHAIHWLEYTLSEITELLSKCGFMVRRHRFRNYWNVNRGGPLTLIAKSLASILLGLVPSFRENIHIVATKAP